MTKSELFKAAHVLAKAFNIEMKDYVLAFKLALITLNKNIKAGKKVTLTNATMAANKLAKELSLKVVGFVKTGNSYTNAGTFHACYEFASMAAYEANKKAFGKCYMEDGKIKANKY